MAVVLGKAWEGYQFLFDEIPDHRTKGWFLVAKPYQAITILVLYLMFVLKWGPNYMKGKPAYNLDKLMIVYNFLQVLACIYIFYYSIILAWGWDYKWICEPVNRSTEQTPMGIAKLTYLYFLMKVIDLLDTVFFVLRKKYNQISFLHIYHHTGMVILVWGAVTYLPGGHGTLIGVINTFVHIVMYSYYLYTVINPNAKKSLWWKKYITQLQIVQFFWCVVHMLTIVFKTDCAYPRWTSALFLPQNLFILILFLDFYIKNYIKKPHAQQIEDLEKKNLIKNSIVNGISNNGTSNENVVKNDTNELKTLNLALNALKNGTHDAINATSDSQNGTRKPENDTQRSDRPLNGTKNYTQRSDRPQNGTKNDTQRSDRLQNGTKSSLNTTYYYSSSTGKSYRIGKAEKHSKSE